MIEQVPEFADGGYWYVVPERAEGEGRSPDFDHSYCAWYDDQGYVTVRTTQAVAGVKPADPATVQAILNAAGYDAKPYGRIGGL